MSTVCQACEDPGTYRAQHDLRLCDEHFAQLRREGMVRLVREHSPWAWGESAGQGDSIGYVGFSEEAAEDWYDDVWTKGGASAEEGSA